MNRVIKKYPNRRLYDTEESRYITLADIKNLVLRDVVFTVIDKKSGGDITRAILLQVISDQERHGDAVMSETFLAHVIRAHDTVSPAFLARHLENAIASYPDSQDPVLDPVKKVVGGDLESARAENSHPAG